MNKITGFIGAALLTGGVLAGCSADSENAVPEENTAEEAVTPVETEETEPVVEETEPAVDDAASDASKTIENAAEKVDEATQDLQENANDAADAVEQKVAEIGDAVEEAPSDAQESVDNATTPKEEPAPAVTEGKEVTGTFNGLADPHTVEIEVDGVPAAYQVDPDGEAMAKFAELTEGDSVTFVYVEKGEQLVINEVM
ncbi:MULTISPECIES: hypothetical protein [Bacillaceae]|uniref:Uncharacterized protein n=1 Tax=Domibacillus aminovorans TaxID=29332 RepID=A0A177KWP0_9BACI|nr:MULTISPECIES: hypothetical protein [Bacillaceae]OAH57800.1 hypothetical protein AWH48_01935 [Domibacillus aminovorans]